MDSDASCIAVYAHQTGWQPLCLHRVANFPSPVLIELASEREEFGFALEVIGKPKDVKGFTNLQFREGGRGRSLMASSGGGSLNPI